MFARSDGFHGEGEVAVVGGCDINHIDLVVGQGLGQAGGNVFPTQLVGRSLAGLFDCAADDELFV